MDIHSETLRKRLQIHGLRVCMDEANHSWLVAKRYYWVAIDGVDALHIYYCLMPAKRKSNDYLNSFTEFKLVEEETSWIRKLKRYAIRAAYAAQVHRGSVLIVIEPTGHPAIVYITVNWPDHLALDNRLSKSIAEDGQLQLGMDPEFVLMDQDDRIVSADKYLNKQGVVGCDAVVLPGRRVIYPLVELRPAPSSEPRQLLIHLMRAMNKAAQLIEDGTLRWIAGGLPSRGLALGGHIHFSGISLNQDILRVLDNYLALPALMVEDDQSMQRRPRYGYLGDFRRQSHGGFEYRTLSSWLVSPIVTKGVIALAKVIATHYSELKQRPLSHDEFATAYYNGNKSLLAPVVKKVWLELESTTMYAQYESYLEPFRKHVMAQHIWRNDHDFRISWLIPPFHMEY